MKNITKKTSISFFFCLLILLGLSSCFGSREVKVTLSKEERIEYLINNIPDSIMEMSIEDIPENSPYRFGNILGKVVDAKTNEPLTSVNLYTYIDKIGCIAETNAQGEFTLLVSPLIFDYEIVFTSFGYADKRIKNISVESGEIVSLGTIKLTPDTIDLKEQIPTVKYVAPIIREDDGSGKPILYFYPEKTENITVELNYEGQLTHTYPKYENGWSVVAHPDGTLFDADGKEYYALYWEGMPTNNFTVDEGTVVRGDKTIEFLETALAQLGLNRREANEFIVYWLPKLESNAYNLIHFSSKEYEEMAELTITPTPETLIRVMMVFLPLEEKIDFPKQNIKALGKQRKGFTVVEWGGTELMPDAETVTR